ncbi:deoxyguanosinetriphosphate triphosphohydrolase [Bifidobacterium gallicum]|uniref:Deoxyguanosinetriphosphate triphosphohydrolase n=2 Tax=Bifidobacterium gallicum DSM 20093 = LMG 11596 TaxID=561180 RepID=A0A087ALA3_9BIFI|nr:deoxyguanosinetriphosphate triphosphohydrolase [Bifidobacterium gallicum]KFI59553.1 deoxyguanosinetriphosphate triphosphohydrolase [Bifidobacterium gallicum DSM 20093 = LMG 11596]
MNEIFAQRRSSERPTPRQIEQGYNEHDVARWAPEGPKSEQRSAFARDRARLIHSSALRRLGAKSQVLVAGTDDFARTRLTHTLEVAQIGRQMARMLALDPDVVDCACLAHDLGHPPFGHIGEAALAELATDIGGFEGNAQTLRVLTRLEPKVFFPDHREGDTITVTGRSAGVNLTRAALDAAVKYPWGYAQAALHPKGERSAKFGVYPDDEPVFAWLKQGLPEGVSETATPMECQVMDLSDDIAYSVHDFEDAVATGALDPTTLRNPHELDEIVLQTRQWYGTQWEPGKLYAAFDRLDGLGAFPHEFTGTRRDLAQLKNVTSTLIGRFASSTEQATREQHGPGPLARYAARLVVPERTRYEILILKGLAVHYVMEPYQSVAIRDHQQQIVKDLVGVMMADSPAPSLALEPVFLEDWQAARTAGQRLRVAIDQVASLTDGSAMTMHTLLCS